LRSRCIANDRARSTFRQDVAVEDDDRIADVAAAYLIAPAVPSGAGSTMYRSDRPVSPPSPKISSMRLGW